MPKQQQQQQQSYMNFHNLYNSYVLFASMITHLRAVAFCSTVHKLAQHLNLKSSNGMTENSITL